MSNTIQSNVNGIYLSLFISLIKIYIYILILVLNRNLRDTEIFLYINFTSCKTLFRFDFSFPFRKLNIANLDNVIQHARLKSTNKKYYLNCNT